MLETKPLEWALANFRCELSQERLRRSHPKEITAALSRAPHPTYQGLAAVYVVGNDANSLLKIGYADNLKNRLSGLNTGSPVALHLIHFLYFVDGFIANIVEQDVHKRLAEFRRKGEWFEVTPDQAGAALSEVVNERRFKWWTEAERRRLWDFVQKSCERYQQRQRYFGT